MSTRGKRRPRLALPFTILTAADTVRLVAGEEFRYSLNGTNLSQWLPELLRRCDGRRTLEQLLAELAEPLRNDARAVIVRLYGERVLIDGTTEQNHEAIACRLAVSGTGALATLLGADGQDQDDHSPASRQTLHVFCQDRLDYEAALQFNRRCRAEPSPWLWASTGAMSRGYVSPVFLPDAGPCLECLLRTFQRLSPAPEIYDDLRQHARQEQPITAVPFSDEGVTILRAIIGRKLTWLTQNDPPSALYRLHVLEMASLEVTTHRVLPDPRCPSCGEGC
jgi:bacteriocin biosynthesis cyclodehydratase domain-containing protein